MRFYAYDALLFCQNYCAVSEDEDELSDSLEEELFVSFLPSISNLLSTDDAALLIPSPSDEVLPCEVVFAPSSFLLPHPVKTSNMAMQNAAKLKHNFFIFTFVPFVYFTNIFSNIFGFYSDA